MYSRVTPPRSTPPEAKIWLETLGLGPMAGMAWARFSRNRLMAMAVIRAVMLVPVLAHGPVGDQLRADAHQGAHRDGSQHGGPGGQPQAQHQRNCEDHGIAAHHNEIAVRKVNKADDAVYHGVAQSHQGVYAAQT